MTWLFRNARSHEGTLKHTSGANSQRVPATMTIGESQRHYLLKSRLITASKWGIVLCALAYLIATSRLTLSGLQLSSESTPLYCLAFLSMIISIGIVSIRHWLLLHALGLSLTIGAVLRLSLIGAFFNTFLLGGFGGDVVKLTYLRHETGQLAKPISSVAVDRGLGFTSLLLLACCPYFFGWGEGNESLNGLRIVTLGGLGTIAISVIVSIVALVRGRAWAGAAWLLAMAAIFWSSGVDETTEGTHLASLGIIAVASSLCVILLPSCQPGRTLEGVVRSYVPFGNQLMSLAQAILLYRGHFAVLTLALGLSIIVQTCMLFALFLMAVTVTDAHFFDVVLAGPPALVANLLPVPGGGLGVGEVAFEHTLALGRSATGEAIIGGAHAFLLFRLNLIACGLLGLPLYLRRHNKDSKRDLSAINGMK